ncbi:M28 family peptidase [Algoriphagus zhangzhouensis]|uniref:Peptidase family M28 n=1 Tax=Algoriphagus zhangzhouensis TaxID=1073327 RepID=A0A1M7Z6H6_9BACT|nr:M28 family peptidase [Algoriphagus zhangzhouensis]TDY49178.1 peptidase M28-like protein [Algoriphagus zhangzhouensis]SHO60548.1 Peptidase family M28 [Algoriphagus zhangzhouensis]
MYHRFVPLFAFIFISQVVLAQKAPILKEVDPYFEMIRPEFKGDLAYETVAFVEQYWRIAGNTGFNNSVDWITKRLDEAGYVLEENAGAKSKLTYRIEKREMNRPTWEPVSASLKIVGESTDLLKSSSNRNMIYTYSSSTPKGGVQAEIVYIPNKEVLETKDLKGKILFSDSVSYRTLQSAIKEKGALGALTYDMPSYLQPEKNINSIQFRGLRYEADSPAWALALSFQAKEKLKAALAKGKVEVLVSIETKIYESEELTVVANVLGSEKPFESLVFSAHIQEPGANDNATGVGTQLEMAQITAQLIQENKLDLDRTLTFLWGDEIISTRRYIQEEEKREPEILWGISLDMVGENTDVTGGSFLIEKMPDPSAIWTRGNDQHTEWGGRPLKKEDMKPHYFNDFILNVFKAQGSYANWTVKTNPFEGGSDHTPFLQANIPGLLLWHFTDQFYHTDQDRLDKVSQETLKNVGTAALASAYTLLNGDDKTAKFLAKTILADAKKRLKIEYQLSLEEIKNGGSKEVEMDIISTWNDWYQKALMSISDLSPESNQSKSESKLNKISSSLTKKLGSQ